MTARASFAGRTSILVVAWCMGLPLSARAQGVGAIGGTVSDTSGGVLPGVTLTLVAPGMIGNGQTTVSDGQGNYEFTRLVAGTYGVKAELEGFRPAIQENLEVNAGRTTRSDLKLAVGSVTEAITVSGLTPLLDTTSTLHQTELTREVLDSVPAGHDQWSIGQLIPSSHDSAFDVGGRNMALNSFISVHGSLAREIGYMVDGLDHGVPQEGSINNKWDTNIAQEVDVQSGQLLAETPKAGVQMNLITKTGTNKFMGSALYEGTNHNLESDNVSGVERAQLLAAVPAKALAENPNIVPGASTQILYDSGIEEGGPIIKDRLWFVGAFRQSRINTYQVGDYNQDGSQLLNDNLLQSGFGKASWAITANSQFHGWVNWSRQDRPHQNGSSATQFADVKTTTLQDGRTWIWMPRFTTVVSKRIVFEAAAADQRGQNNKAPQPGVGPGTVATFDSVTNTLGGAAPTYHLTCCDNKVQAQASMTVVAGQHDVKVGYQYTRSNRSTFNYSTSNEPAGLQAVYANGTPTQVHTYNTPTGSLYVNFNNALFVQDKWRVTHRLTANLGVRVERDFE
ncbi:MAG TPA: TonB-dependent receptor, partial [Vicinamibacterales bacterium]|nr:TonB-dependent receptor [Vicinamibacterales bacterium]